jgi:Tfp pilus assembly protein FimT
MSTLHDTSTRRERNLIYIVAVAALVVLAVIGLIAYRGHQSNRDAEQKADELIAAIEQAGFDAPDRDQIVGVLGDDGGATCDDPDSALTKATLRSMLVNGAAGPGIRPVIADSLAVKGQLLIITIYCPDELPRFSEFVDDLTFDDTVDE